MAATGRKQTIRREIELDFIRGVAILTVVDYHSPLSWLFTPFALLGFRPFGWAGVDLFFILSGFLVGGLLVKEWTVKGRVASGSFLIRRGLKIWPPYYVLMAGMLLTGHRGFHELWGNLLNIQNYTNGVAFTWSLAVEEHAYLLLVLMLAVAAKFAVRMRSLFVLLGAASLLIVLLRLLLITHGYEVFYATHTRIEGIFYGVMLAMLYHCRPEVFRRIQRFTWLWVGTLLAGLLELRFASPYSRAASSLTIDVVNLMSIALLMLLYRRPAEGRRRGWLYRGVAWVGLYSYGIYLWHVSMISPIEHVAARLPHLAAQLWLGFAPMLAALILGVFFTKLIEFPTLKLRDRLFPRRVDSAVGIPAEAEAYQGVDGSERALLAETEPAV